MAIETRKEKMDHMFALMDEVRVLVGRLEPHDTGHIHTTINVLNARVEEIRLGLSLNKHELDKLEEEKFNMRREDPFKEGTD
jgi:nicotinamide mononucleotide adenylyltransferase